MKKQKRRKRTLDSLWDQLFHSDSFANIKYSPNSSELSRSLITVRFPVVVLAKPGITYVRSLASMLEVTQYEIRFMGDKRRIGPGISNGKAGKKPVKQSDYAGDNLLKKKRWSNNVKRSRISSSKHVSRGRVRPELC